MAKLRVHDLEADVELDHKAMVNIIGGRGPAHRGLMGFGPDSRIARKQCFNEALLGKVRNRYAR